MKSCDSKGMLQECSGDSSQTFKRVWKKTCHQRISWHGGVTKETIVRGGIYLAPVALTHRLRTQSVQRPARGWRIKIAGHDAGELD